MNRKKIIVGLASAFSIISWMMITVPSHAVSLVLDLSKLGQGVIDFNDIKPIHFSENNNDFWGLFYFLGGSNESNTGEDDDWDTPAESGEPGDEETENTYTIEFVDGTTECMEQKRWLYYNAERWERLRPIDEKTKNAWFNEMWLGMTWWIFTRCPLNSEEYKLQIKCCQEYENLNPEEQTQCEFHEYESEECVRLVEEKYADSNSYYGIVTHDYSWQNFLLTVWVKYATWTPWVEIIPERWKTFQANPAMWGGGKKLPFGLIYDNNWWVWFVWCKVNQFAGINDLIESGVNETWIINFFELTGSDVDDKPYLQYINDNGNSDFDKFMCKNIWRDMTTALGILVEWLIWLWNKTEDYSIWDQDIQKSQYFASASVNNATLINHARQKAEMLCRWKRDSKLTVQIKPGINCLSGGDRIINPWDMGKTIIVKNWNVTITPFTASDDGYYDIFIDSWNLIIDEYPKGNVYDTYDYLIANDGFPTNKLIDDFEDEVKNIIIEINNETRDNSQDSFNDLTDVGVASILKWNFIVNWSITGPEWGHLERKYFIYWKLTSLDNNEKLRDTFEWRCNSWIPTYGKYCYAPGGGANVHSYQNVPLAIIDQNYDSPLLK